MNYIPFEQFEKENSFTKDQYRIRTKKYANPSQDATPQKYRNYSPVAYKDRKNQTGVGQITHSPHRTPKRYQPLDFTTFQQNQKGSALNIYNKSPNKKCEGSKNGQLSKKDIYCYTPKYQKAIKTPKAIKAQIQNDYTETSYNEGHKLGDGSNINGRREKGRAREFEMKINNISVMNDQICSLLSMVKNDRHKLLSNKKSDRAKDSPKREDKSFYEKKGNKKDVQESERTHQFKYHDRNEETSCRMKTYTGYEKEENKPQKGYKYSRQKAYTKPNDEQNLYKVNKGYRQNIGVNLEKGKTFKPTLTPKRKNQIKQRSQVKGRHSPQDSLNKYYDSDSKRGKMDHQIYTAQAYPTRTTNGQKNKYHDEEQTKTSDYKYIPKFKGTLRRDESLQGNFLPISLQNGKQHLNIQGTSLIDEKLKRIRDKITESQVETNKIQKRLITTPSYAAIDERQEARAGRLYRKGVEPSRQEEQFQLQIYPVKVDRHNVVNIAEKLLRQSQMDQTFKTARSDFDKNSNPAKWQQLQRRLQSKGVKLMDAELKEILRITPDQYNPSDNYSQHSSGQFSELFIQAQQHWQKEIVGCASERSLRKEQFDASELDMNHKGYLSPEDIVSYISLFTGKSLRIRDIVLVFRRLQMLDRYGDSDKIEYQTFMRVIAS